MVHLLVYFLKSIPAVERSLVNNDYIRLISTTDKKYFIHKMTPDGKYFDVSTGNISVDDIVSMTSYPVLFTNISAYSSSTSYNITNIVSYNGYAYRCIKDAYNIVPTNTSYWQVTPFASATDYYYYDEGSSNYVAYLTKLQNDFLLDTDTVRFKIKKANNTTGVIYSTDEVVFEPIDFVVYYSVVQANNTFGAFPTPQGSAADWLVIDGNFNYSSRTFLAGENVYYASTDRFYQCIQNSTGNLPTNIDYWVYTDDGPPILLVSKSLSPVDRPGTLYISHYVNNPTLVKSFNLFGNITYDGNTYTPAEFGAPCRRLDLNIMSPIIEISTIKYNFFASYNLLCSDGTYLDCFYNLTYNFTANTSTSSLEVIENNSKWFKISLTTNNVLTDKYLHVDGVYRIT